MKLVPGTLVAATLLAGGMSQELGAQPNRLRPLPEVSQNMKTGPEIGATIPPFQLPDQDGNPRSLKDLAGLKGLVLAFVRSADW
jgi:hypothetical protein